ncbi:MAG: hypothetical protein GXO19_06870 [Epsilonproteobacteria bacterium]|nr:hypothetical protein [Campylobacterota bacterium]NPA57438.1 hypothetical protein [Campylobacterota bacterium]
MYLHVLTTTRQIRQLLAQMDDGIIDKYMTIGEFFERAVVVPGRPLVDRDMRKLLLYRAQQEVDLQKLGIEGDFFRFFRDADMIMDLWSEMTKEQVKIEELIFQDLYGEYEEHLRTLELLLIRYRELLEREGLADMAVIDFDELQINSPLFRGVEGVRMELVGYLSRLERKILAALPVEVTIEFTVTPFNRPLITKMFGELEDGIYSYNFSTGEILDRRPLPPVGETEVHRFSQRIWQVHHVLASIEEFVEEGLDPERIAVILPDEGFADHLRLFNNGNLNFAMGEPFTSSHLYITLKAIYDYLIQGDPVALEKIGEELLQRFLQSEDPLSFIQEIATERERIVLDEELYKMEHLLSKMERKGEGRERRLEELHFILQRLSQLSFDDTEGGKVTVMGVLESRGMEFDGVIIVDFNEEKVPKVSSSDLFLNSTVRERAGMPTRKEREALQKHYYDQILRRAKRVRISYVENEEEGPSRFLYELGLGGEKRERDYRDLLFHFSRDPEPTNYTGIPFSPPTNLTPTTLATLLECTKRYYFQSVLNLKNELPEEQVNFGLLFHNQVAQILKRGRPPSPEAYFNGIMEGILQGREEAERFELRRRWEEKVRWFAYEDFPLLAKEYTVESFQKSRPLGRYKLWAQFDRMDRELVIDYKSSSRQTERDRIQSLFYRYIYEKEVLFYYLGSQKTEGGDQEEGEEDPGKEIGKLIDSLIFVTKDPDDPQVCTWCPYRFICRREG